MEKIDLTKCNNCRYKAKIDGIVTTGIVSAKDGINAFLKNEQGYNVGCLTGAGLVDSDNRPITDFEIVPRDPETYRDWQVGDIACEKEHRNARYEVIFRSGELVFFKDWNNYATIPFTCSEVFTRFGFRLVLTDIERQIIEEKKKKKAEWKPQEGDICYLKSMSTEWLFIKRGDVNKTDTCACMGLDNDCVDLIPGAVTRDDLIKELRPATDAEKQRLFAALAREGKRWNAEKKVVEDIPKPYEFKKGEPVLVRSDYGRDWTAGIYVERSINPDAQFGKYGVTDGRSIIFYRFCIPYNERTMHLLGTTEDYKEEQS